MAFEETRLDSVSGASELVSHCKGGAEAGEFKAWRFRSVRELQPGDIHVWLISLAVPEAVVDQLSYLLAEDEAQRAASFRFDLDRRRFIVAKGVLRSLLGKYLKRGPREIQFRYGAFGKPYITPVDNRPAVHFSISHSHEWALIGLCVGHQIGIDIEYRNPERATMEIAKRLFSREEVAALVDLAAEDRSQAFFAIWTRKEAYIKGRGAGVSLGLGTFAVSAAPDRTTCLLRPPSEDPGQQWRFWTIDVGIRYAAALAVESLQEPRLSFWLLAPETLLA